METRGAGARWTRLDARAVATEVSLSGAARTRDAGVEGEDDDDDDWVVVRAPARRDDDDGEVSSEVADDEAEDGDGDGDGDVNVETMDEDEGADARGKREMDAMDAMAETADAETARTIPPLPWKDAALVAEYYAQFQVRMELDRARLARRAAVREDEAVSANDDDDDDDDESEDSSSQTEFGEESDAEDDDAEDDDAVEVISKSDVDIRDNAFDRLRLKAIEAYRELEKRIYRVAREGAEAIAPLSRDLWDRFVRCTRRMARRKFDLQKEASSLTDVIVVVTASGIAFIVARKCFSALMARNDRAERAARSVEIDLARCWHDAGTYGYFV